MHMSPKSNLGVSGSSILQRKWHRVRDWGRVLKTPKSKCIKQKEELVDSILRLFRVGHYKNGERLSAVPEGELK